MTRARTRSSKSRRPKASAPPTSSARRARPRDNGRMSGYGAPQVIAKGLRFPEGPVPMADGSVLLVEIARGTLTRVAQDGSLSVFPAVGRTVFRETRCHYH